MATNTQFSIAVHFMTALGMNSPKSVTSSRLAQSVNTSPSFVRRTLSKLSKAGLVHTTTGKNGACSLARTPKAISLLDIYEAVESPKAFAIHQYPEDETCPVSCNIKPVMEKVLKKTQRSTEESLGKVSLADVISGVKAG
jgi:Rrf2 family protein